jgi:hypothetical protein
VREFFLWILSLLLGRRGSRSRRWSVGSLLEKKGLWGRGWDDDASRARKAGGVEYIERGGYKLAYEKRPIRIDITRRPIPFQLIWKANELSLLISGSKTILLTPLTLFQI